MSGPTPEQLAELESGPSEDQLRELEGVPDQPPTDSGGFGSWLKGAAKSVAEAVPRTIDPFRVGETVAEDPVGATRAALMGATYGMAPRMLSGIEAATGRDYNDALAENQRTIVDVRSVSHSLRTKIIAMPENSAPTAAASAPNQVASVICNPPMCGDRMIMIPAKPTATALQR